MQSSSTQSETTSRLYDTLLYVSRQPGTTTLTPTQLPAQSHDLHPSTVRATHLHCLHLRPHSLTYTHKQTNKQTNVHFIPCSCCFHSSSFVVSLSNTHPCAKLKTQRTRESRLCSYLWKLAYIQNNICPSSRA